LRHPERTARVLVEVFGAAFCPSCGAALKSGASAGRISGAGMEMYGGEGGIGAVEKMARAGARSQRARSGNWEPKETPVDLVDYPGEAYPKNIRMFTTSDEMELTKRFIRLIDKDDSAQQTPSIPQIDTEKKADNSRKSKIK
jgi:hypothetical protein